MRIGDHTSHGANDAFGSDLLTMLEAGAGLVIGTVDEDGAPRGTRVWAFSVVDPDACRIRVVFTADDPIVVDNLATGRVAVTGCDVRTFRAVQLKGRVVAVDSPTADDVDVARDQTDRFFQAVRATDGNPIELLERMLPHEMAVVEVIVEEQFDQTPGPAAGAVLGGVGGVAGVGGVVG